MLRADVKASVHHAPSFVDIYLDSALAHCSLVRFAQMRGELSGQVHIAVTERGT